MFETQKTDAWTDNIGGKLLIIREANGLSKSIAANGTDQTNSDNDAYSTWRKEQTVHSGSRPGGMPTFGASGSNVFLARYSK
jgi:hypothetical protein